VSGGGRVRVGILGAAKIAPRAMVDTARARDDVEVVCVAARERARAHAFAETHGAPQVAASYAELIGRDDIDLVYVALHAGAHAEWTIRALEAGKAVLCEKPFAMSAAEAGAMVAAAEIAGRPLLEAFHYRFHPVLRRAFEVIGSGRLGRLIACDAMFETPVAYSEDELRWRAELGGGALMDLGCYAVHALRTVAGAEPEVIAAKARMAHGVDVATTAELRFPDGVDGRIACAMDPERFAARLFVRGEAGTLEIVNFVAPQIGCRFTVDFGDGPIEQPTDGPSSFAAQLQHVADVMLRGAAPMTGGQDSVATMAAIEAIYAKASVR
jgi:predicted dehydrogenase